MKSMVSYVAKVSAGLLVAVVAFVALRVADGVFSLFGQQIATSESKFLGPEVAHADIPYAQSYYQSYYESYYESAYQGTVIEGSGSSSCESSGSAC